MLVVIGTDSEQDNYRYIHKDLKNLHLFPHIIISENASMKDLLNSE